MVKRNMKSALRARRFGMVLGIILTTMGAGLSAVHNGLDNGLTVVSASLVMFTVALTWFFWE